LTKQLRVENDDGSKRIVDGETYHVCLDPAGGRHSCECRGFLRHGHCKHVEALWALRAAGQLTELPEMDPRRPLPPPPPRRLARDSGCDAERDRLEGEARGAV
jgi:hypothetical protein